MEKTNTRIGLVASDFDTFKLKSILEKNDAGDWGSEPQNDAIGVIRSTNFNNDGELNLSNVAYRNLKPNKRIEKKLFKDDILIERSGGSDSQPVGRVGLITYDISNDDYAFANFIQRIAVNDTVKSKYLFYCLQQMYEMGITKGMQYQTTGIRNLDWKLYTKSILPKPPSPEQTAIATILSKVDEAIDATRQSIKAAEKLKKALMQNLLTGKLKPDGTWRTDDEFYEDEKFGKVPVGWEVKKLGEFGEFLNGVNFSKSQLGVGHPFVNLKDIYSNEEIDCEELDKVDVKIVKGLILKKGDIVFVRSSVKPSGIGWVSLFNGSEDHTIFCGFVIKYSFDQTIISPKYLNTLLLSNPIRNKIIALGQVVANTNINQRVLKSLSVYFSLNIEEQLEINKRLKSVDSEIQSKQTKIRTLQRLKKSLMQNLLTGKIRLNVAMVNDKLLIING